MDSNWYISVDGKTYGPYSWEQMYEMTLTKQIVYDTYVYHEELGVWVEAYKIKELNLENQNLENQNQQHSNIETQAYHSQTQSSKVKNQHPKKKSGCLKGCLTSMGVFLIIGFLLIVFVIRPLFNKEMIDTEKQKQVVKAEILETGGVVEVDDKNSAVDGMTIDIPSGAYDQKKDFKISTKEIKSHEYGENFNPITPVIHVDNGGAYSEEMMTVRVPIDIDDDLFAMAVYYREDGILEPIQMLSQTKNEIVFGVRHFSDIVITALPKALLDEFVGEPDFNSGFIPGVDNWPFVNRGGELSPKGNCNGMSLSMIHYYLHHKKNGEPSLHTYIDNNFYMNTPALDMDDSQGLRLVGDVQNEVKFGLASDWYFKSLHKNAFMTDKQIFYHFAYAFLLSDQNPQIVGLFVRTVVNNNVKLEAGHAIVAYAIDKSGIYVCDPNYPDRTDLKIPFNGENFEIYNTAINAEENPRQYNSFSLIGTTSVVPEAYIENLFDEIKENPYKSTVGDAKGSNPHIEYLIIDDGEVSWVSNVESIEIKPEDAAKYKEKVLEYINDNNMANTLGAYEPDDWGAKPYIAIRLHNGLSSLNDAQHHMVYHILKGNTTTPIATYAIDSSGSYDFVALEEGANYLGFRFDRRVVYNVDQQNVITYKYRYSDYQRVQIVYGDIDLSGTWKGEFQIENYDKAMGYAEDIAFQITKGIGWIVSQMTGEEFTDSELKEIANSSIEVNEGLTDPMDFSVILSNKNGGTYDAKVNIVTDGIYEYNVIAEFDGEALSFTLNNEDGSSFDFKIYIYDNSHLNGDFDLRYGGVSDFVSGVCELTKE